MRHSYFYQMKMQYEEMKQNHETEMKKKKLQHDSKKKKLSQKIDIL